jgi:molybdopterin-containing oxidoreductase family membrane subunit
MAPMFVIMSFAYGLAAFLLVQTAMFWWNGIKLDERILVRMKNLLAVFIAASMYFTIVFHLTNLYFAKQWEYERFILLEGGIYTTLFWVGQVLIGYLVPLALLFSPGSRKSVVTVMLAAFLAIVGGHVQMYVTIVGGQAFPLDLFPGFAESSSFFDGVVHSYSPSGWEWLLGMGGLGIAFLATTVAVRVFKFLPQDNFAHLETDKA